MKLETSEAILEVWDSLVNFELARVLKITFACNKSNLSCIYMLPAKYKMRLLYNRNKDRDSKKYLIAMYNTVAYGKNLILENHIFVSEI